MNEITTNILKDEIEIDDEEIIIRLLDKDDYGVELLFNNYSNYIINYLMSKFKYILTLSDCEEISLDTILKINKKIEQFDSNKGTKFSSWIIQIAKNTAIDIIKQQKHKFISIDEHNIPVHSKPQNEPQKITSNDTRIKICQEALASIPEIDKEMITTDIYLQDEELTNAIFEKELNISRSHVRVKKKRAYDKIKKYLIKKGYTI